MNLHGTPTEVIDRYCSAWQDLTESERRNFLHPLWQSNSSYRDPAVEVVGIDALAAYIEKVQTRYPNSTTIRTSVLDLHHSVARFSWTKVLADGTRLPEGIDFVEFNEGGSIKQIVGFFGALDRR